jgi:hypothetical protein
MVKERNKKAELNSIQVNLRLTIKEGFKVTTYAQASGLSRCRWIKKKIFGGRFPAIKQSPIDAFIYRELQQIAIDLNLLMKQHSYKEWSPDLLEVIENLMRIRGRILTALLK